MLKRSSLKYEVAADLIDRFMSIDLTGVGLIHNLYQARQRQQPGPDVHDGCRAGGGDAAREGRAGADRHRLSGGRGRPGNRRSGGRGAAGTGAVPGLRGAERHRRRRRLGADDAHHLRRRRPRCRGTCPKAARSSPSSSCGPCTSKACPRTPMDAGKATDALLRDSRPQ